MLNKDYGRTITLRCPTCASTEFSGATEGADNTQIVTCTACGLETTRADLKATNAENIQAHVDEIGREFKKDVERELKKTLQNALRGSKNIRIK